MDGITDSMDMNLGKLQEMEDREACFMLQSMKLRRVRHLETEEQIVDISYRGTI